MRVILREMIFNKPAWCFLECHLTAEAENANPRIHTLLGRGRYRRARIYMLDVGEFPLLPHANQPP